MDEQIRLAGKDFYDDMFVLDALIESDIDELQKEEVEEIDHKELNEYF